MSRLTSARAGVPSANKASRFKGFRRTEWFVGNQAKRDAHDGSQPLVRTWREGEPVIDLRTRLWPGPRWSPTAPGA